MAKEQLIQVGTIHYLRSPTGEVLPSVPIFKPVEKPDINPATGGILANEKANKAVAKLFADKMKQYIDGGGVIKRAGRK